jgi:hypothetical protein
LGNQTSLWRGLINIIEKTSVFKGKLKGRISATATFMSSASSSSELFSVQSAVSDLVDRQGDLPNFLRQSLHMLDLQPEVEIAKYRHYKEGKVETYARLSPVVAPPETDEEDYEVIPPSEPFAILERSVSQDPPGGLVFQEPPEPATTLDLNTLPPGEISSARSEYLPASEELWRSLGKPAVSGSPVRPRWQLPVAVGSSVCALAAVGGMTYVNMHPALLQQVPLVAQVTAPAPIPAIPPGQSLQGPDLAMSEFSDLSLGNINAISVPSKSIAQAPEASAAEAPAAAIIAANSPIIAGVVTNTPASPAAVIQSNEKLANGLMRNLLPPNIQQMAGQIVPQPRAAGQQVSPVIKPTTQPGIQPYVPKQMYFQPTESTPRYQVMTKYVNPIGMAQVKNLLPQATIEGDRINLGSFSEQSDAANVVKKLQQQGIQAWLK